MPDIELDPFAMRAAAQDLVIHTLDSWKLQLLNYREAAEAVHKPTEDWFGGRGGTGRLPAASQQFLERLASEIDTLIAKKDQQIASFEQYLNGLTRLANNVQAADEAARDKLNKITQDLKGGS